MEFADTSYACLDNVKGVSGMRKLVLGLPLVAVAAAFSGQASAMAVSTGSPSFQVDWSDQVDRSGDTVNGVATFSNFALNANGTSLSFDLSVANTTAQPGIQHRDLEFDPPHVVRMGYRSGRDERQ